MDTKSVGRIEIISKTSKVLIDSRKIGYLPRVDVVFFGHSDDKLIGISCNASKPDGVTSEDNALGQAAKYGLSLQEFFLTQDAVKLDEILTDEEYLVSINSTSIGDDVSLNIKGVGNITISTDL